MTIDVLANYYRSGDVDTLPDQVLTADLEAPEDTDIEPEEYVLSGWSISRGQRIPSPYTVTLRLLKRE